MSTAARTFHINSVGADGVCVSVWALPMWLKSDRLVKTDLTPRQARSLAIKLLNAADKC